VFKEIKLLWELSWKMFVLERFTIRYRLPSFLRRRRRHPGGESPCF
jgi:hypothetical protein